MNLRVVFPSQGTLIKYGTEIMKLLQAVLQPKEVAITHCKAHQKGNSKITKGNWKADQLAKEVALKESKFEGSLIPECHLELSPPEYTERTIRLFQKWSRLVGNTTKTTIDFWKDDESSTQGSAPTNTLRSIGVNCKKICHWTKNAKLNRSNSKKKKKKALSVAQTTQKLPRRSWEELWNKV